MQRAPNSLQKPTMTSLSVNLNKIALLRNSRGRNFPSVTDFAQRALESGAAGITLHPRPDQRHARFTDLYDIKPICHTYSAELNIEGFPSQEFLDIIHDIRPDQCTLVPDNPEQLTSDHGWDIERHGEFLEPIVKEMMLNGIRVSLFTDPHIPNIRGCHMVGAQRIELYTEQYAHAYHTKNRDHITTIYAESAAFARTLGLEVNAGHDLSLENVGHLCSHCHIDEVSIGHALIVEALHFGFEHTVKRYVDILQTSARKNRE